MTRIVPNILVLFGTAVVFTGSMWCWNDATLEPLPSAEWTARRDCGAVSLYAICRLHDRDDVNLEYLRALTETDVRGTNMLRLRNAAEYLGFEVSSLQLSPLQLREQLRSGGEAIVHLRLGPFGHFMAITGISGDDQFLAFDAQEGAMAMTERDLCSGWGWRGAALILRLQNGGDSH